MLVIPLNKKEQKRHQPGKDPKSGVNESAVISEMLLKVVISQSRFPIDIDWSLISDHLSDKATCRRTC